MLLAFNLDAQYSKIQQEVMDLCSESKETKALKMIDSYLTKDQNNDSLHFLKGSVYFHLGDGKNAFLEYSEAIKLNENFFDVYLDRAALLMDLHLFEDAKLDYEYALKIAPVDSSKARAKEGLAGYYLYTRDFQKSVSLLEEVLVVFPEDLAALNNIAIALEDIDRREDAIVYLKRVVEIDSTFFPSYVNLGYQLSHVENYEEALFYFDKAEALESKDPYLLSNRGFVYYKLGDYKRALNDLNLSLKFYVSNAYAYKNRALVYLAMGENEKACEDLYLAKGYGFLKIYGDEVKLLIEANCIK